MLPIRCPQGQVDDHELRFVACKQCGEVGKLSFLAATQSLSRLHERGIRILSLYEMLVFTYRWHLEVTYNGYYHLVLAS